MERFAMIYHGCKVNRYDGERVRTSLLGLGLAETDDAAAADLVVLQSCAVTDRAARKGRQALRAMRRKNPGSRLLVTGCFTPIDRAGYENALPGSEPGHGVLLLDTRGNSDPATLRDRLASVLADVVASNAPLPADPFAHAFEDRTRAYLKVEDGCDARCAFCVIPSIRGPVRSKPLAVAVAEARAALARGFREIVVCGIHLGHYGRDTGESLPSLIDALIAIPRDDAPADFRIRLGSLEATEADAALAERFARAGASGRLAPHLHVPLQSGDDGVLNAMRRTYTARTFARRLAILRGAAPELAFTTDVIVGFPGETEAAFGATLDLVRELRCAKVHVFPYSPRAGTEAATLPGRIAPEILRARVRRLLALDAELRGELDRERVGARARVLVHEVVATPQGEFSRGSCERHRTIFVRGRFAKAEFVTCVVGQPAPFAPESLLGEPVVASRSDLVAPGAIDAPRATVGSPR